ncbi:hypothetical protein BLNAU_13689 [Blattamonas nauphoetae]|uniref:Uncharacterized protein n=1 Tax=Blattamonas nauphoetae TaxID=2049346 RepID=A0ABQ9XI73_9EUKA|nr:hypothetical protein BLNAU_13689 [Blattamonas nauphoetae]
MGNAASRRIGQVKDKSVALDNEAHIKLIRKLLIIIDSCVGVLHRDDFIDLDRDLYDADHFDLSRFLYLSFDTLHHNSNERENLKPFFFRSAILSLFGQLIVNAMTYIKRGVLSHDQKCPFLHVITGAPGIGKTANRYPFITLLMGFGVKTITTKREGECGFVFRRTDKTKAGRAKVTVQDSDGQNIALNVQTYLYHYDVFMFDRDEGIRTIYHPKEGAAYDPRRLTDRKSVCLGQLIVPSVECFPHFLRLIIGKTDHVNEYRTRTGHDITVTAPSFLKCGSRITQNSVLKIRGQDPVTCTHPTTHIREDMRIEAGSIIKAHSTLEDCSSLVYGFSVQNKLENTEWNVIDEFVFFFVTVLSLTVSGTTCIPFNHHCVLFASPDGTKWNNTSPSSSCMVYFIAEYIIPKFSLQEEAAFLNMMGEASTYSWRAQPTLSDGLRMFSFVPRFVIEPFRAQLTSKWINNADAKTDVGRKKFFASDASHNLVHFTCPQYDCHNWAVQFATDEARQFVLEMFGLQTTKDYRKFLKSLSPHPDPTQINGALFHDFVMDAIADGLTISSPTRLASSEPLDCGLFRLPEIIGESNIHLRSSTNISRANLPDLSRIDHAELSPFEPEYDVLFQHSIDKLNTPKQDKPKKGKNMTPLDFRCFTYSLNALGGNDVGYESILLFFKVHMNEQEMIVDALSAIVIKPTLAYQQSISSSASNLMFMWLGLFSNIYGLQPSVVFPHLFFVKSPFVQLLSLHGANTSKFFMDERNIWVVDGHTQNVEAVTVERRERLFVNSVVSLIPNTNPLHFRCCFCGLVLKEEFPNHICERLKYGGPVKSSENLITSPWVTYSSGIGSAEILDRHNPRNEWTQTPGARLMEEIVFTLMREDEQDDTDSGQHRIELHYSANGRIPNWNDTRDEIDAIDIVLIAPMKERNDFRTLADEATESEPELSTFRVVYETPILNIFSYFPQRPLIVKTNPRLGLVDVLSFDHIVRRESKESDTARLVLNCILIIQK